MNRLSFNASLVMAGLLVGRGATARPSFPIPVANPAAKARNARVDRPMPASKPLPPALPARAPRDFAL